MNQKERQMSFKDEMRCDGALSANSITVTAEGFLVSRTKYRHIVGMTFSVHLGSQDREKIDGLFRSHALRFTGRLFNGDEFVAECLARRSAEHRLEGEVTRLDIGVGQLGKLPTNQIAIVQFTPTDLALPEVRNMVRHWTGEIRPFDDNNQRETMKLAMPFGPAEFSKHCSYEKAYVDDDEVMVQVPVPTLSITVNDSSRTADTAALIDVITEHLAYFESSVSFLSRRQVRWTEIEVFSESLGDRGTDISSAHRMRAISGSGKPTDWLVHPRRLGERDLDAVFQTFVASPYRESIEHTVNYLNANWREDFIESKMTHAFTAFETMVNGIDSIEGSSLTVSSDVFKKLRKILETHINEFSETHALDKQVRKEMYAKLAELQRRPVIPRAVALIERHSVDWTDLWSKGGDLEAELNKAYARRSRFIHAGRIDDYGDAIVDANRVHALTERLVYSLLGGKKEWLDHFAYHPWRWTFIKKSEPGD